MHKADICFILVEPVYKGNVGAAARVINNFGFSNLRIVGTVPSKEDHYVAVHSEDIMDKLTVHDTLQEALADIDNAVCVSRRSGRKKTVDFAVNHIAEYVYTLPRGKTAFVFGRETYGVTDEEADLCPIRCVIPATESFPSLNLAQAVAIVAYELYLNAPQQDYATVRLAGTDAVSATCLEVMQSLRSIGYFHTGDERKTEKRLENLLMKSYTTEENLAFLRSLFKRIEVVKSSQETKKDK